MSLVLRNRIYHAVIRFEGKQKWKSLKTRDKNEAWEKHADFLKELKSRISRQSWARLCERYLEYSRVNKKSSYPVDKIAIQRFSIDNNVSEVSEGLKPLVLESWKSKLLKMNFKPASINRYMATIKHLAAKALEWELIDQNRLGSVPNMTIPKSSKAYYGKSEIEAIRRACKSNLQTILVEVALRTGMRRGELQNLQWQHIDFKRNLIKVLPGKNNEERFVPMSLKLKKELLTWKKESPGSYILSKSGNRVNKWILSKKFKNILKRADLPGSIHHTRHTWITHLSLEGVNINHVQKWAGHKDIRTTNRIYTHVKGEEGGNEINKLPY